MTIFGRGLFFCGLLPTAWSSSAPFEPDPVFDTIDLNATYTAIRRIFSRMNLSPKEMAVLIGAGHSSGQGTLEGGTYHGNWVEPMTPLGNAYFQLLSGHRQWCAVKSSDNGNAHFVAKGVAPYIAETEYSPLSKYIGQIPCVETQANKAVYDKLPSVPAEELINQPGTWHKPSGAAAMLPVDFALQYAQETYVHVATWAFDQTLFFHDFQNAWLKMTENGQSIRCSNINGLADFGYSKDCAERFGLEAAYRATWKQIQNDIKAMFDTLPDRCTSIRPTAPSKPKEGSVCASSVLRLGFHVSATYDPTAANEGGSSVGAAAFLGPCSMYDGCGGCLQDTLLALQHIQKRYKNLNVSLADVTVFAAGMAAARLAEFKLNHLPFHPGRVDPQSVDPSLCKDLGARLPSPAYQWQCASKAGGDTKSTGMLSGDLLLPDLPPSQLHSDLIV